MNSNLAVVVDNRAEFEYMVAWCEDHGRSTPFVGTPVFPFVICPGVEGELSGWTNRKDRNLNYVPFIDFVLNKQKDSE